MCGIAGVLNLNREKLVRHDQLQKMTDSLTHRGPDDAGFFHDQCLGLGHRRLSILDVKGGHQPWLAPEQGRALVYNGEIYNYREIKALEEKKGTTFVSTCDTEVLMHLIGTNDVSWLNRLNGMFAFAHWDGQELFIARDRIGIKPLYYCLVNGQFLFASEIKALLAAGVPRNINRSVAAEFFAFRTICGEETLFEGIYSLPPGHTLQISPGMNEPKITQWWSPAAVEKDTWVDSSLPVAEQFESLFKSSIQYRLISDVPVGTYNSGGVDSSLISAYVQQLSDGPLHTFSVGFEEDSHDESRYSRIVADQLGTNHHTLIINGSEYADGVEDAISAYDQPLFQDHTVQLMKLSRVAKQFVTVVLTGEGADELFAGYPRYQIPLISARLAFIPGFIQKGMLPLFQKMKMRRLVKLFEVSSDSDQSVLQGTRFCPQPDLEAAGLSSWTTDARKELWQNIQSKGMTRLEAVLDFDRQTYMPGLMHRLDRTTMVNGLEARVPFLDHRMLEWSMGLQAKHKMVVGRENKVVVKEIAARIFPHDMIYRRKVGFGVPTGEWLRQPRSLGRFLDVLRDGTFGDRGFCDPKGVERLLQNHLKGEVDHGHLLWSMINFELWCRSNIDQVSPPVPAVQ